MNNDMKTTIDICKAIIGYNDNVVSDDKLNEAVNKAIQLYPTINKDALKKELMSFYSIEISQFQKLIGKDRCKPWLKNFKANEQSQWLFWKRYKQYLKNKGFAPKVLNNLDLLTDEILDNLFNPLNTNEIVNKRGLVVGQVQSGKTANYTGLICKAADSGFNFIIVLAGIHNNLRSQTQLRLDEGFLGFDTQNKESKIGVGQIRGFDDAVAHSVTTSAEKGDFNKGKTSAINFDSKETILLVVKKNASVLKRIVNWLNLQTTNGKISKKALFIVDDEADNASINTAKDDCDPTKINKHIRSIINLFNRSAYVGYTATPFANIFIPFDKKNGDEDLFPRDFIISLPIPSNYIGPEKIFGTKINPNEDCEKEDLLPIVVPITDYENFIPEKHKRDDKLPVELPESLKQAIRVFIMVCAIRMARNQGNEHNSMLIHISRFILWQNHIKDLVENYFMYCKQEIEAKDKATFESFKKILEEDEDYYKSFQTTTNEILNSTNKNIDNQIRIHSWKEIEPFLNRAVQKIEVNSINGNSADALKYNDNKETGISVIAVGGDKLSRGLTLEGLSVSYFLRASKMYDTLMQMGRWFGYRPGYVDLCRLYTSPELNEWFRHITMATEELREEFRYMSEIKESPETYQLKVRTDPGLLQITAAAKMRHSDEILVSWSGRLIETYQLSLKKYEILSNLKTTEKFLSSIGNYEEICTGGKKSCDYLWRNIPSEKVINFFSEYQISQNLKSFNLDLISEYIKKLNDRNELNSWSVVLKNKSTTECKRKIGSFEVGTFLRTHAEDCEADNIYQIKKNHIIGNPEDEFIDLEKELLNDALARTKEIRNEWTKNYPSPKIVREEFRPKEQPLLIIYPLNPEGANSENHNTFKSTDEPFIGFAISFPKTRYSDAAVAYRANQIEDFRESEDYFDDEAEDE